jgi:hypothetical protein
LVGGLNVTGDHYTMDESVEQVLDQTNALGDTWEEFTPVGLGRATLEMGAGLYDDRTAGQLAAYQSMGTTQQLVALGFKGHALGAPCSLYNGTYANTFKRTVSRANLTMANASHTLSGARIAGLVLHPLTARTSASDNESSDTDAASLAKVIPITSSATSDVFTFKQPHGLRVGDKALFIANHTSTPDPDGNTYVVATVPTEFTATFTALDITVGGTGGSIKRVGIATAVCDLHVDVNTLGGYTNLAVTLRHSDDGTTWATAATFAVFTAAYGSERTTVTNLKRYRAAKWLWNGAGSAQSARFLVGCEV